MDEDIKPTPEEEGKEFGYFPFEELPSATTQIVEEVIVCVNEADDIKIQHMDPVTKIKDIELPMPTERFITLQKTDPVTKKLRQQWENKQLDSNTYLLEDNILK